MAKTSKKQNAEKILNVNKEITLEETKANKNLVYALFAIVGAAIAAVVAYAVLIVKKTKNVIKNDKKK